MDKSREQRPPAELMELMQGLSGPAPKFYASSTSVMINNSDVVVLLKANTQIVSVLNLSYTSAKTLATNLLEAIHGFEGMLGQKIMTSDDIGERLKQHTEKFKS